MSGAKQARAAIGIDLGGTKILCARVEQRKVVAEAKQSTPGGGPETVVEAMAECVREVGGTKGVAGVGVGAPGIIWPGGVVHRAPNLSGFDEDVPLGPLLSEALGGVAVSVDNDVNVGTLGEYRFGAGRGVDNLLGVFVGTGVGGGVVLDGVLRRGPGGVAGEVGHMIVHDGGRVCGCGLSGHLEAYAGRAGMEREARRRHAAGEPTALVGLAGDKRMKSGIFAKALDAGDQVAVQLLDEAVGALGAALASAVALIDVELVVLGGGMADRLGAAFAGRVEEATRSRLLVPGSPLRAVLAELGDQAGAMGASLLVTDPGSRALEVS